MGLRSIANFQSEEEGFDCKGPVESGLETLLLQPAQYFGVWKGQIFWMNRPKICTKGGISENYEYNFEYLCIKMQVQLEIKQNMSQIFKYCMKMSPRWLVPPYPYRVGESRSEPIPNKKLTLPFPHTQTQR